MPTPPALSPGVCVCVPAEEGMVKVEREFACNSRRRKTATSDDHDDGDDGEVMLPHAPGCTIAATQRLGSGISGVDGTAVGFSGRFRSM